MATMLLSAKCLEAQWLQTGGPGGGGINSLTIDGNYMFVGTNFGIFRSTDRGTSWKAVNNGLLGQLSPFNRAVLSVAMFNGTLFAGARQGRIFKSIDSGNTWSAITPVANNLSCFSIIGSRILAGVGGCVYYSDDHGVNWNQSKAGTGNVFYAGIRAFSTIGPVILAGAVDSGAYRSLDSGATWSRSKTSYHTLTFHSLACYKNVAYAGTGLAGIQQSTDSGKTWEDLHGNLPRSETITALTFIGDTLFAGIKNGYMYHSRINDTLWTKVTSDTAMVPFNVTFFSTAGGEFMAGTASEGLYRSLDYGHTWSGLNDGLANTGIYSFTKMNDQLICGTAYGGIFSTTDNGSHWTRMDGQQLSLSRLTITSLIYSDNTLFAGTSSDGTRMYSSKLDTWTKIDSNYTIFDFAVNGDSIFEGITYGVKLSPDRGATWKIFNAGLPGSSGPGLPYCHGVTLAVIRDNLFVGLDSGGVYRINFGDTVWTAANNRFPAALRVCKLFATGDVLYAGTKNSMFRSMDLGANWTEIISGLPNGEIMSMAEGNGKLFAGTRYSGVFSSSNSGTNWNKFSTGLPESTYVNTLAVFRGNLFAGLEQGGVWRRPLDEVSTHDRAYDLPAKSRFDLTFENPSSPSPAFIISLAHAERIRITMHDLSGRQVVILTDKRVDAGTHRITCDRRAARSGCYIVTVKTGTEYRVYRTLLSK